MDETPSNGVEALVRDAVSEQKAKGLIPTPNKVKDYLLPLVEQGERKSEASRLRVKPNAPEPKPAVRRSTPDLEREVKVRMARKGHEPLPGGWTETRKPTDLYATTHRELLSKRDALAKTRMRKRLRLLWSKPDWREKLMQVNPLAINGQLGVEKQDQAHQAIRDIIRDSARVFGEWLAEPKARPLHFHGK